MVCCRMVVAGSLGVSVFATLPDVARADIDPNSGIDLVTVGNPGNLSWIGSGFNSGHGQVNYEYRIGSTEVPLSAWAEFMNAALDRPAGDQIPHVFAPTQWSAVGTSPNNPGGHRYSVPAGREMFPVGGVDWRTCAIYCNWLHNGKSSDRSAFLTGAYDVSTFGYLNGGSLFTDQLTRSPGARYWIPSLDEWMKAVHWDPNKSNDDGSTGGYWLYGNGSDTPFVYGPPGVRVGVGSIGNPIPDPNGQLSTSGATWTSTYFPGLDPFAVPLGSYPNVQSPWGLLDASGGVSEWTELVFQLDDEPLPRYRVADGLGWTQGSGSFGGGVDGVGNPGGGRPPNFPTFDTGLRIAAVVPAPGMGSLGAIASLWALTHRRRRSHEKPPDRSSPRTLW